VRLNQYGVPNIQMLRLPMLDEGETEWRHFLSWRVPIDDANYVSFNLNHVHITGEARDTYRAWREPLLARMFDNVSASADRVLAGEVTIDEVRDQVVDVVLLQDEVVLDAQGTPPHHQDHLGRSDAGVILLRKIWRRELRALAEGKPMKQWNRPAGLVATTGL
jgi:5,5'-dehydrodivanillate O-demethylase